MKDTRQVSDSPLFHQRWEESRRAEGELLTAFHTDGITLDELKKKFAAVRECLDSLENLAIVGMSDWR